MDQYNFDSATNMVLKKKKPIFVEIIERNGYVLQNDETLAWSSTETGIEERGFWARLSLSPLLEKFGSPLEASFRDRILYNEENCVIIETTIKFTGIPGGECLVVLRQCFSRSKQGPKYVATFDIQVSESSWFKESIKKAFIHHFGRIFEDLASEIEYDSKVELTVSEIYFDKSAFMWSLLSLFPFVFLILSGLYILNLNRANQIHVSSSRAAKIYQVKSELNNFINSMTDFGKKPTHSIKL